MRRRTRGYLLVEMTVVIALLGLTLGLLAISLQSLLRISRRHCDRHAQEASLLRLDVQLRRDVHQAMEAIPSVADAADSQFEQLTLHNQDHSRTHYSVQGNRIQRVVYHQDVMIHRDRFALQPDCRLHFALESASSGHPLVCLVMQRAGPGETNRRESTPGTAIRAVVGGEFPITREPRS